MFKYLIKANHECETKKTELLLRDQNIIYALSSTSRVDFQALKLLAKQNKFTPLKLRMINLQSRKIIFRSEILKESFLGRLQKECIRKN